VVVELVPVCVPDVPAVPVALPAVPALPVVWAVAIPIAIANAKAVNNPLCIVSSFGPESRQLVSSTSMIEMRDRK
jgi:hypothetical protein